MRVLYAADTQLPSRAANTVQSMRTVGALQDAGHDITFVARGLGATPAEISKHYGLMSAVRVVSARTGPWPFRSWQFALAVGLTARSGKFDVLVTRSEKSARIAVGLGVPTLLELHVPLRSRGLIGAITRDGVPALVTISEALKDEVRLQIGETVQVAVIHDGAPSWFTMEEARVRRAVPERLKVGYVGHLYPGKGMEMIEQLSARCEWADFVVVGGEDSDIERWRSVLHGRRNINLLGHRAHHEIHGVLAGLDVGLLPNGAVVRDAGGNDISAWTSPLKMFEYMAAGLAIVASDLPNLREVLVDDVNALMRPVGDVNAWASALELLRREPTLRRRLGVRAARDLEQHYSWRRRAERLTEVMLDASSGRRSR